MVWALKWRLSKNGKNKSFIPTANLELSVGLEGPFVDKSESDNDETRTVPIAVMREFVAAAKKANKKAWMIEQKDGDVVTLPVGCGHAVNNGNTCSVKFAVDLVPRGFAWQCLLSSMKIGTLFQHGVANNYMHIMDMILRDVIAEFETDMIKVAKNYTSAADLERTHKNRKMPPKERKAPAARKGKRKRKSAPEEKGEAKAVREEETMVQVAL